jgi:hypothetical protein
MGDTMIINYKSVTLVPPGWIFTYCPIGIISVNKWSMIPVSISVVRDVMIPINKKIEYEIGKYRLIQVFVTITVIENVVSLPVTGSQERI